jgi:hypothetical protein
MNSCDDSEYYFAGQCINDGEGEGNDDCTDCDNLADCRRKYA